MPSYRVLNKGFFHGRIYDPDGKRPILDVNKPFTKKTMPSWVELIEDETDDERDERMKAQDEKSKEAEVKRDLDKEIQEVSFADQGGFTEQEKGSATETI